MENFKSESAFNFVKVLYLKNYLKGHRGYIAGGCFKNIFNNEKIKDIDIFFRTENDFEKALNLFNEKENYVNVYENENAVGFWDNKTNISIDLVRSEFGEPDSMIERFDFTITKFAFYTEEVEIEHKLEDLELGPILYPVTESNSKKTEFLVTYHESFFEHLMLKRLVVDSDLIKFPLNTFDRIIRYTGYGYSPCKGTKAKIVRAIAEAELPSDDSELFKGLYNGID